MTNFENTFIRGPSPSYSEDQTSENGMSTLPIGDRKSLTENLMSSKKFGSTTALKSLPRDRNTFAFWTLVSLLFILTIGNLLLTITIIGILKLGKGMQNLEIIQNEDTIKFFGAADLDRIYKRDGAIEGYANEPVTITGEDSEVAVNFLHRNGHSQNKFSVNKSGIFFKGIDKFEIKNPVTGDVVFTTHRPHYNIPKGVEKLYTKIASTSRITSPIGKPLMLLSDGRISVRGSEGLFMEGQEISFKTDQNIYIKSMNGSIVLSGSEGIFLDMENIPVVNSDHGIRTGSTQYKICICMPHGKLFRVPVPRIHNGKITCTHFNAKLDPCL